MPGERVAVLIALPAVAVPVAWLAVLLTAAATGTHPIWNVEPRTAAEAAAFRDAGAFVRFVDEGASPDEGGEVRVSVISHESVTRTPLEAAAAARDRRMLQVVIDHGASLDADAWNRAWCLAAVPDVRELLVEHRPAGASDDCGAARTTSP